MDPHKLLKIVSILIALFVLTVGILPAFGIEISDDPFVVVPEAGDDSMAPNHVEFLGEAKGPDYEYSFRDEYALFANDLDSEKNAVGAQLKSGIISWNFILGFLQQFVRFIANAGLIVGALSVIYAGYQYALSAISGGSVDQTSQAKSAIRYAAIGIVIIIFSYAILNIVVQAFL